MAQIYDVANALIAPNWGESFGKNLGNAVQGYQNYQNKNALLAALKGGDQAQIVSSLAALDPGAALTYKASADKTTAANLEAKRGRFYTDLAGSMASVSQLPQEQQDAAWKAAHARLAGAYPEFGTDPGDDDWATAKMHAPALAAMDKNIGELFGRYSLIPQEPAKPEATPAAVREYEYARGQGYKGTFQDFQIEQKKAGAASTTISYGGLTEAIDPKTGRRIFVQPSNRGGVMPVQGAVPLPPGAGKDPTEDQSKAAAWYAQATQAMQNMRDALAQDPRAAQPDLVAETLENVPYAGEYLRNKQYSPAQQKYQNAISSFSEAALRAATGAGITKDEAQQKIRELSPRPGDSDALIQQKMGLMQTYVDSLRTRAGRALGGNEVPSAGAGNVDIDATTADLLKKYGG